MSDKQVNHAVTPGSAETPLVGDSLFRSVFSNTLEAIVITDADGQVLEATAEACFLFGRTVEELRATPPSDLVDITDPRVRAAVAATNDEGRFAGPLPLLHHDGSRFHADISVTRFTDAVGQVRVCAFVRDVAAADRRALEAKVQHAQKLESLGVLAGGIAHDFNNLLVGILGNASLALTDLPDESPLREIVADIETTALRAADLTNQMLAYSGKGRFVVNQVDVNALVREMAQLLQTVISKRAALRFAFEPNLPCIEADATQLRQIVMNLITNASDAIGNEDGVITLRTGIRQATRAYLRSSYVDDELPEGRYAFIEVEDTGCGMDTETGARIFDPFFSTKFTGRGLGLAATLGIVRGHHGTIKAESTPGQGTLFTILLPCAVAPRADVPDAAATRRERFRGSGPALVVDDDEMVRLVAQHMLERSGFTVLTARDGSEGVSKFAANRDVVSLVLLDLTMPSLGGEDAFRAMRQMRPDVRVVLMSGYSRHELAARYGAEGLAGFIQKPFRLEELDACLTSAMDQAPS